MSLIRPIRFTLSSIAIAVIASLVSAQDQRQAYPVTLNAEAVREFQTLNVKRRGLTFTAKDVAAVPIECEPGITGAFLVGDGAFRFTPPGADPIKGRFRAVMLRFNPDDLPAMLPLEKSAVVSDRAAFEMSRHLMQSAFRRCWHSGMDALLPDSGTLAAVIYSREHGELLISASGNESIAYSFSENRKLYPAR